MVPARRGDLDRTASDRLTSHVRKVRPTSLAANRGRW